MKKTWSFLTAISHLIRLPNLLIIALTQLLLRYAVFGPFLYHDSGIEPSSLADFLILVLITVLIAAGGYIINDYFDVKIDAVNKPDKITIDRNIPARGAIATHLIINAVAIILGFYLAYKVGNFTFGLIFPFLSVLLWLYSASYKRTFLWGNIIVAALSAFVVLIVWLFEFFHLRLDPASFASLIKPMSHVTSIILAYALFAFLVTVVREVIKDMEDAEGDQRYGCRTLPLVIGQRNSRLVIFSLLILSMILLGYGMLILYRLHYMWAFWYFLVAVQAPVIWLVSVIWRARQKEEFHFASMLTKVILLTGILSMQILSLNF